MSYKNVRLTQDNYQDKLELQDLIGLEDYEAVWYQDQIKNAEAEARQIAKRYVSEQLAKLN